MAYVEVEDTVGGRHLGSAFHVGDGVFVTARHVLEGGAVIGLGTTESAYIPLQGEEAANAHSLVEMDGVSTPVHIVRPQSLEMDGPPVVAANPLVDVGAFRVTGLDPRTPWFPLGSHLDDWIGESDFVLSDVIVFGYPPIPFARRPTLVAARAQVVAQIDRYDVPHVHFVLSSMPRGGFSGGVAFSEWGFVLGVLTQSLTSDGAPTELGYFAATSVEPIYECLAQRGMLPACQQEGWDGFWVTQQLHFIGPGERPTSTSGAIAGIEYCDTQDELWLEVGCGDGAVLQDILQISDDCLSSTLQRSTPRDHTVRFVATFRTNAAQAEIRAVGAAIVDRLLREGYQAYGVEDPSTMFA